ncbi:MAG: tetratricopeptide repeat protein [Planctomycetaceae bacterium]|nr:tetratricopeptide repeat protein [Planctomycetaceae bacterium]
MNRIRRSLPLTVACLFALTASARVLPAQSISECQEMFRTGQYQPCAEATGKAIENRSYGEDWPMLKADAELALGRYDEAAATVASGIERYSWSVRLRMMEHQIAGRLGNREQADAALKEIERLVAGASWRYTDSDDLVSLGHAALELGADPRDVQEGFFERARRNYKTRPDGFLAAGQLAMEKGDFQLASEILIPAAKDFPKNPDIQFALSQALSSGDREQSMVLLKTTLELNPHYAPALQIIAQNQIDAEDYEAARTTLQQILATNPNSPEAHALMAVLHHLTGDTAAEQADVTAATKFAGHRPAVYHLIGTRLSRKYRFAEGAEWQRKALEIDAGFNAARTQLAQDLLRLGRESEGWELAEQAHKADGYSTTLFNLLKLKDSMQQFTTLHGDHFELRMEAGEAKIYGRQALALLEEAYALISARYAFEPEGPIVVEIFPRADDFAVRTFGIPDVAGFLGVCFGRVITANSPASRRENPSSWESVLWHEFCHVVTLQMTGNRIPRWLSEGISVYEERRRDSRWGQRMTSEFHERIVSGQLTPISALSGAFLNAESGADLNFAYFESSMAVEFIVDAHGLDALIAVLKDLRTGISINDALDRHCGSIEELDAAFPEFLRTAAAAWAGKAEFAVDGLTELIADHPEQLSEFVKEHPDNVPAGMAQAQKLMTNGKLEEATILLQHLTELIPEDNSLNGPRRTLATLCRRMERTEQELQLLNQHVEQNSDDLEALDRLQEVSASNDEHARTISLGRDISAVDPFRTEPLIRTALAAEATGDVNAAIAALSTLLQLQPDDAARLHLRLAKLFRATQPDSARHHVLLALEQAPRYREAHRFLLELKSEQEQRPDVRSDNAETEETPAADSADRTATVREKEEPEDKESVPATTDGKN